MFKKSILDFPGGLELRTHLCHLCGLGYCCGLGLVPSQETSACHGHNQKKEKSICIPILVNYYMHHVFIFAPHKNFSVTLREKGFFYEFRLDQCYIFYNFLLLLSFSVSPCTSKIHGLLLRFYNLFKFLES